VKGCSDLADFCATGQIALIIRSYGLASPNNLFHIWLRAGSSAAVIRARSNRAADDSGSLLNGSASKRWLPMTFVPA
jgi:hypothetical protein